MNLSAWLPPANAPFPFHLLSGATSAVVDISRLLVLIFIRESPDTVYCIMSQITWISLAMRRLRSQSEGGVTYDAHSGIFHGKDVSRHRPLKSSALADLLHFVSQNRHRRVIVMATDTVRYGAKSDDIAAISSALSLIHDKRHLGNGGALWVAPGSGCACKGNSN